MEGMDGMDERNANVCHGSEYFDVTGLAGDEGEERRGEREL